MAVTDTWISGQTFTAADEDSVARAINGSGWLQRCQLATVGSETFTIASGDVTQITGTTLDGQSVLVGYRVLIKDAPATTGVGSVLSTEPANGVYDVTAVSSSISLARVYEMSNDPPIAYAPSGLVVEVEGGTNNGGQLFNVVVPSSPAAFTYGTDAIQWRPVGYQAGTGLVVSGSTIALSSTAQTDLALASTSLQSASGVLTTAGGDAHVASMATGQIIAGSSGSPAIVTVGGDVTIDASGSIVVQSNKIGLSKLATLAANSVIGNLTGSTATPTAVPLSAGATVNAIALRDANANLFANSFIPGVSSTATAGGTTTLTAASTEVQQFTGTATQVVVLPDATTLAMGQQYLITNRSTAAVTVNANGGATLQAMVAGSQVAVTLVNNSTAAGGWDVSYTISGLTGTVSGVSIATTNGFAGTSSGGSTPALTLSTTVTGVLKGNGTAIVAAISGIDYAPPTSGSSVLKADGSGGFSNAVSGTDYAPATATTSALRGNGAGGFTAATLNDVGAPTANYGMGGFTLTGLPTPTATGQAATKDYVDALFQGASGKYSAEAATTGSETYTISGGNVTQISGTSVDGISPNVNDYILVKDAPSATGAGSVNSTQPGNGLYQVTANTSNLNLTRATAMTGSNSPVGAYVFVSGGTNNGGNGWIVTTPSASGSFTYGSGNIHWTQFTGAGEINTGPGLSKNGNTLSIENSGVLLPAHGGTGVSGLTGLIKGNGSSAFTAAVSGTDYAPATTGSAILKASSGGFANAVSGTDYAPPTTGTSILKGNGSGGFAGASSGTDYAPPTSGINVLKGDGSGGFATASFADLATPTSSFSMGGYAITNAANPTNSQDLATKIYVDSGPVHPVCILATTGVETYTISSNTVTQINGLTIDGVSAFAGWRILIKDAPFTSGTGAVLSSSPANGIYVVTSTTSGNLLLSRAADMSGTAPNGPAGNVVTVTGGTVNALSTWKIYNPQAPGPFPYGSSYSLQWAPDINAGNVLTRSGNTISVGSMATGTAIIGNFGTPAIASITGDISLANNGIVTIRAGAVTLSKMANIAGNTVIGNSSSGTTVPSTVSMATGPTAGAIALRDSNANVAANAFINGVATTVTTGGTTTLTVASAPFQQFTGTSNHTVTLPNATTLANGQEIMVANRSSGQITVQDNGSNILKTLAASSMGIFTLVSNSGSNGTWDVGYMASAPYDFSIIQSSAWTPRTAGSYGDNPFGVKLQRACTLTSVTFRCYTADGGGSMVVNLTRNGSAIAGTTTTISYVSQVAGVTTNFSQACSAGDVIDVYVSSTGTTPGNGLVADITGNV